MIRGQPISPGYAEGTALLHGRPPEREPGRRCDRIPAEAADAEAERLRGAVDAAIEELESLCGRVREDLGEAHAAIFAVQVGLLRDAQFIAGAERRVREDRVRAEAAFEAEVTALADQLASAEQSSQRERAQDIRDIGRRVLCRLRGEATDPGSASDQPFVLVARELLPSDTVRFGRDRLAGIVTESGGDTSHTAILARALGVPTITGVAGACDRIPPGAPLLVDGESGELILRPTAGQRRHFEDARHRFEGLRSVALAGRREPCVTRDGVKVTLRANVGRLEELAQIGDYHLTGVGLLRTEILFADLAEPPTVERQVAAYRRAAAAAKPGPLVIRTFDFGADKLPVFMRQRLAGVSDDPANCGLRFSLAEESLLRTQLGAIIEAARQADVRILLPMVCEPEELTAVAEMVSRIAGKKGDRPPPIGAMIETPEAVCRLEGILEHAAFLSVGTNDLSRLMLGADRGAAELPGEWAAAHPRILRALRHIVERAEEADRPAAVCGEAAGHPDLACLLIGLGFRELSVSPIRSPHLRYRVRGIDRAGAERLAERALAAEGLGQVRRQLEAYRRRHVAAPGPQ